MACDRCLYFRIQHRFGTLDRTGRSRCIQWYGYGTLGNSGMDDLDSGMGVCTLLHTKHGIYNAGILERRYNPQSRTILSVISLVSYVLTKVAVTVYAGGLVFQQVFGIKELWGIDFFWIAAIGLVILTALYTIFGGMKSVLYTSILQTPILLLGSLIILVLGFKELGGWDEMMRICGAVTVNDYGNTMTELIRSNNDPNFPWLGALIGSAIIGFWYW